MKIIFYLFHVVALFLVARFISKKWKANRFLFWGSLTFHLSGGIAVGLIYSYYYAANDTWHFFNDATQLTAIAKNDFGSYLKILTDFSDDQFYLHIKMIDFRSLIFVKLLSIFCLISGNSYWILAVDFSFLAFISAWFLYTKTTQHICSSHHAAALAFLFFPSIIFWSSGIEKETVTLASLYFLSAIFLECICEQKIKKWFWPPLILASAILWSLKYYWAGVFFMSAISALLFLFLSNRFHSLKNKVVPIFFLLFFIIGIGTSIVHPNFYLTRFLEVLVSNHEAFVRISNENGLIHFYDLKPTVPSILINSPLALVSGIFRPIIGEGKGWLALLASLENFIILLLFFSKIFSLGKTGKPKISILALAAISYCVVLSIFLSLSTPNFGTLSRYRVGFLPFLIFMLAYRNLLIERGVQKLKSIHAKICI